MGKLAYLGVSLLLLLGLGACGSDKKAKTAASSPAPATPVTDTKVPGDAKAEQRAETIAAVECLRRYAKNRRGIRLYGRPAVVGTLPSRNVIVMAMYGPKGGARGGEVRILKEHPTYSAYNSPDDKILVVYVGKVSPGSPDFRAGDTCQRAAAAAG